MEDPLPLRIGGVVSADIAVPEHERELRFYARVLTTGPDPLWRDDLMNSAGQPVIGLGERTPEYADLPLQWMPHIQVADVASSVERALTLGGTEIMHGKDGDGASLWAALGDPSGVAFGIIPVVSPEEIPAAERDGPTGHIAGIELAAADTAALRAFYREVIGWSSEEAETCVRAAGDGGIGGAPAWLLQLPVGDLEESLVRAREEGGTVASGPHAIPGGGQRAVIEDPVGVRLTLVSG